MTNFLYACVLIMPWLYLGVNFGDQFRAPKAAFFDVICMGIIFLGLKNGLKFQYKNKYLAWFILWIFVTIFFNWHAPFTFRPKGMIMFNLWTLEPMIHFLFGLMASYVALSFFDRQDYEKIAKAICISAVLMSIFSILQHINLDPFGKIATYKEDKLAITALLDNFDLVGNYLCLTIPFFLYFRKNIRFLGGLILVILALIFCNSDLSLLAAAGSVFVFIILSIRNKKLLTLFILCSLIALTLFIQYKMPQIQDKSIFSTRIEAWQATFPFLKNNPVFGSGLGIFKTWSIKVGQTTYLEAHNDWLELACQIGLFGVLLMGLVILNMLKSFNYKSDNKLGFAYLASFLAFLVVMAGSFPLEIAAVGLNGLIAFWGAEKL